MEAPVAKWPFPTEYLVGVRRNDGTIEHYLQPADDAMQARQYVDEALLEKKVVLVRVK